MSKEKYLFAALLLLGAGTTLSARPHHNEGLHLASEIVGLVRTAVAPAPVVVTRPAPVVVTPPAPVVVTPPASVVVTRPAPAVVIPNYGYGWWQGTWVPCYRDWYWYHGTWVWGGRGPRPVPPRWAPDFKRRPMPPPPRVHHRHHRPAPPPPRVVVPPPRVVVPPPRVVVPPHRHHPAPPPPHHRPRGRY